MIDVLKSIRGVRYKLFFGFSVGFMACAVLVLLFNVYQIPIVKQKLPWLDNQIRIYHYERMARKLPPGDEQALRLRAMAEALKKNSKEYTFTTGSTPTMK